MLEFNFLKIKTIALALATGSTMLLSGCAAKHLAGYQPVYHKHTVPEALVQQIKDELKYNGLKNVTVKRDLVGRIQLDGHFQNEDEVDLAFVIVQSHVGSKSTSPFYPENIKVKRWEIAAKQALSNLLKSKNKNVIAKLPAKLRNNSANINSIQEAQKVMEVIAQQEKEQFSKLNVTQIKPKKRALIIGISKFKNSNLTTILGEQDGMRVAEDAKREGYDVMSLLGSNATKKNIEMALKNMSDILDQPENQNDVLLVYISSHGLPATQVAPYLVKDGQKMAIAAYDSHGKGMGEIFKTSISDDMIRSITNRDRPGKTYVIIDTCYSGEILRGTNPQAAKFIESQNGGKPERKSPDIEKTWAHTNYTSKGILLTGSSTNNNISNDKSKDLDFNKHRTFITATSDGELSWGGNEKHPTFDYNGAKLLGSFFTQSFFEELKNSNSKGLVEPAFNKALSFTKKQVVNVVAPGFCPSSDGIKQFGSTEKCFENLHQVPKMYSTSNEDRNLYPSESN